MTVARSARDVLTDHVVFEVECMDRMYCNVYVPQLQYAGGLIGYLQRQLGLPIASTAPLAKITDAFSTAVHRFARANGFRGSTSRRASARTMSCTSTWPASPPRRVCCSSGGRRRRPSCFAPSAAATPMAIPTRGSWPPLGWSTTSTSIASTPISARSSSSSAPTSRTTPSCASTATTGPSARPPRPASRSSPLDNGFAAVEDPAALQAICDRLGPEQIDALLRKWLAILPHPFAAEDRAAGYRYDISILQAEFSLTQMLDKPVSGRVFFEQVIRDNLDTGRPDQVALIFDRRLKRRGPRATPGPFRTRVITEGVTPSLHVDYKHTRIKQYHKEGRALRTETTINDTTDFSIGKRLTNLPALREIGFSANRRLLRVQSLSYDPITGAEALHTVTAPITTNTGTRIPGLQLGQPRSHALLAALPLFRLQPDGFANKDLRALTAELRGLDPATVTAGQITYDLRRLRVHGLITRIPHTHRYRPTEHGLHTAMFISAVHDRFLPTGLAQLADELTAPPLRAASRTYRNALDNLAGTTGLAA